MKPLTSNILGIAISSLFFAGACDSDRDAPAHAAPTVLATPVMQAPAFALAPADSNDDGDLVTLDELAVDDDSTLAVTCDPFQQNCVAGRKCANYSTDGSWGTPLCVPVNATPRPAGALCTTQYPSNFGVDNCAVGTRCWNEDPTDLKGTCVAQCGGSPNSPQCGAGTECIEIAPGLDLCLPPPPACDPWAQNCGSGEKCVAYAPVGQNAWNATRCVPVPADPGAAGDECVVHGAVTSGNDSCGEGLMCWDPDPVTNLGVCRPIAGGAPNAPSCPDPSLVTIGLNGLLDLCVPSCDPLAQECASAETCMPHASGVGFVCVIDASGEEGQEWDLCEWANACDPGFACLNSSLSDNCDPNGIGCCIAFCDVTNPACTDPDESCLPYYAPNTAPPGQENVGLCGLPW